MIIFGRKRGENVGNVLFQGDIDKCQEFADRLDKSEFETLTLDEDNGIIKEWLINTH